MRNADHLPPSCADCQEIWGALTSWNPVGHSRPVMEQLTLPKTEGFSIRCTREFIHYRTVHRGQRYVKYKRSVQCTDADVEGITSSLPAAAVVHVFCYRHVTLVRQVGSISGYKFERIVALIDIRGRTI